jgi:potassium/hydrogen antiporter
VGVAAGVAGRELMTRVRLPAGGLYPALTLSLALFTYGTATILKGSGFLAVYIAGLVLGNATLPFRSGLIRLHDALAWLSQIGMFLMLGLLVFPTRLAEVSEIGLLLALFLAVVARPVVVAACIAFFGYPPRELAYIGWVGLRGAVPIILATYPVLQGAPGAERVFDIVFFVVVVSAIIPGATVPWVTKRLAVESPEPPAPAAILEIEAFQPLRGELLSYYVDDELAVCGAALRDVPMPEGAVIALIVRGNDLVPPKGRTVFQVGDHVYVLAQPGVRPFVELLFGRPEER